MVVRQFCSGKSGTDGTFHCENGAKCPDGPRLPQGPQVGQMVVFQWTTPWPQRLKPGPRVGCVRYDWNSYPSRFWRRTPCGSVVPPGLGSLFPYVPRTEVPSASSGPCALSVAALRAGSILPEHDSAPQRLKPGPRVGCVRYDWKSYPSRFWRRIPCGFAVPPGLGSLFPYSTQD